MRPQRLHESPMRDEQTDALLFFKCGHLCALQDIRSSGLVALQLNDDDELRWVQSAYDGDSVVISASDGQGIHLTIDEFYASFFGNTSRSAEVLVACTPCIKESTSL
eukprot:jgi/Chlat1/907/Chrsp108S01352